MLLKAREQRYFGPPAGRKPWEIQVDAPVGQACDFCRETIQAQDTGTIDIYDVVRHYECTMRAVVGSVAHIERRCSCFGGTDTDGDPAGMTRREAAVAATRAWARKAS